MHGYRAMRELSTEVDHEENRVLKGIARFEKSKASRNELSTDDSKEILHARGKYEGGKKRGETKGKRRKAAERRSVDVGDVALASQVWPTPRFTNHQPLRSQRLSSTRSSALTIHISAGPFKPRLTTLNDTLHIRLTPSP